MLSIIRTKACRSIFEKLSKELKKKLRHPKEKQICENFYGNNAFDLFIRAFHEIDYSLTTYEEGVFKPEDLGYTNKEGKWINYFDGKRWRDGNWLEFISWTGLTEEDMNEIEKLFRDAGYTPGMREFPLNPQRN